MEPVTGLRLGVCRGFASQDRSVEEIRQVKEIGDELRLLRKACGFSRLQLVTLLGLDIELLVAVENGYGDLEMAIRLLEMTRSVLLTYMSD